MLARHEKAKPPLHRRQKWFGGNVILIGYERLLLIGGSVGFVADGFGPLRALAYVSVLLYVANLRVCSQHSLTYLADRTTHFTARSK